jgi:hypothetical protein
LHGSDVKGSASWTRHAALINVRRTCAGSVPDGQTALKWYAGQGEAAVVLQRAEVGSHILKIKDAQVRRPLIVTNQIEARRNKIAIEVWTAILRTVVCNNRV